LLEKKIKQLRKIAVQIRKDCINTQREVGSGHLGGSFSAMETMIYLYFHKMNIDCAKPKKEDRDYFILSKGHASLGYYCVLARAGFFPIEELSTYRRINSRLQGHTHIDSAPGIECSTGSLGQGLSFGIGIALGLKKKGLSSKVYVMLGDGEMEEGQVWEALMLLGHLKLDNVVPIIDYNKLQLDDVVENVSSLNNISEKIRPFGFRVLDINGHDFKEIHNAFEDIKQGEATAIVMHTIKGKGISFMENSIPWHSKKVNEEEYIKAMEELRLQEVLIDA
jgi:transketolase